MPIGTRPTASWRESCRPQAAAANSRHAASVNGAQAADRTGRHAALLAFSVSPVQVWAVMVCRLLSLQPQPAPVLVQGYAATSSSATGSMPVSCVCRGEGRRGGTFTEPASLHALLLVPPPGVPAMPQAPCCLLRLPRRTWMVLPFSALSEMYSGSVALYCWTTLG